MRALINFGDCVLEISFFHTVKYAKAYCKLIGIEWEFKKDNNEFVAILILFEPYSYKPTVKIQHLFDYVRNLDCVDFSFYDAVSIANKVANNIAEEKDINKIISALDTAHSFIKENTNKKRREYVE